MKINPKLKVIAAILLLAVIVAAAAFMLHGYSFAVLDAKGTVSQHQRDLIIISTLLMLIVVLPVFVLTFVIAWRYREGNTKATYTPKWDHSHFLEGLWWGIPFVIIVILSVIIWRSSHELDPFKPLARSGEPLRVQVVALQWKWLFIYPDQDIATVNTLQLPQDTPINFEITADAPMNSFWIPSLGGQIYAMPGMTTKLHLDGTQRGIYEGSSANISGEGFAGMRFKVHVDSREAFNNWVNVAKRAETPLTTQEYDELAEPSRDVLPIYYNSRDASLYDKIVMKYMAPGAQSEGEDAHNH